LKELHFKRAWLTNRAHTLNIAPGAFEALRVLTCKDTFFTTQEETTLLQGIGQQLEVFNLDLCSGQSNPSVLQLLGGPLTAPWIASLRSFTISLAAWRTGSYPMQAVPINEQCDQLFAALIRLQALESLQVLPNGLMDLFISRFISEKDNGRFACLRELNLMKRMSGSSWNGWRETSTCSVSTALRLRLWVEMNKQGLTRGLHIPFYPLPQEDRTLLHTLNSIMGKSSDDGYANREKGEGVYW
jgi:hypothetical protein